MVWTKELREELYELKVEFDKIKKWQFWKMFQLISILNRLDEITVEARTSPSVTSKKEGL